MVGEGFNYMFVWNENEVRTDVYLKARKEVDDLKVSLSGVVVATLQLFNPHRRIRLRQRTHYLFLQS